MRNLDLLDKRKCLERLQPRKQLSHSKVCSYVGKSKSPFKSKSSWRSTAILFILCLALNCARWAVKGSSDIKIHSKAWMCAPPYSNHFDSCEHHQPVPGWSTDVTDQMLNANMLCSAPYCPPLPVVRSYLGEYYIIFTINEINDCVLALTSVV